jgi:hypothetical protein
MCFVRCPLFVAGRRVQGEEVELTRLREGAEEGGRGVTEALEIVVDGEEEEEEESEEEETGEGASRAIIACQTLLRDMLHSFGGGGGGDMRVARMLVSGNGEEGIDGDKDGQVRRVGRRGRGRREAGMKDVIEFLSVLPSRMQVSLWWIDFFLSPSGIRIHGSGFKV